MESGPILDIHEIKKMTNKKDEENHKLERIIDLLKFALSLDDEEIMRSTVEAVIELLQELSQ